MNKNLIRICVFLFFVSSLAAQEHKNLHVFLTCNSNCDPNFLRTNMSGEIEFVNDIQTSNVQLFMTSVETGSGGDAVTMVLKGRYKFAGIGDTIKYILDPNVTDDEERRTMMRYFRAGLVRFFVLNGQIDDLTLSVSKRVKVDSNGLDAKNNISEKKKDPFNFWIFNMGLHGNFNGEKYYKSYNIGLNTRASRVTEKGKWQYGFSYNKNQSSFLISEDEPLYIINNYTIWGNADHVFSINNHWSYGVFSHFQKSTYNNYKAQIYTGIGIEHNFLDYKLVNEKYITLQYRINAFYNNYFDTTLYNKRNELLAGHAIDFQVGYTQTWGNAYIQASWTNYFHDWSKFSASTGIGAEIRVFKGFNIDFNGGYNFIRNQINLPIGGASDEEILTKRRQLATSFSYYGWFGINYRFGSIYNNVVNPRFNQNNFF